MNEIIPFVGRSKELKLFTNLLNSNGSHLLWVQGPGGVGKTWLLNEMSRLVLDRTDIKSVFIDYYSTEHHYISGLYSAIISQLGEKSFSSFTKVNQELEQLQNVGSSLDPIRLQQKRRDGAFIDCYNELETKTRILLLFDTIEIVQTRDSEIFQWILNQFLPNIKNTLVVMASRFSLETVSEFKNVNTSLISLQGLSTEEALAFFEHRDIYLDPDLFRRLFILTRGQPVFLSLTLDYLSRGSLPFDLEDTDSNEFKRKLVQSLANIESPFSQIILLLSQADQGIDANLFKYLISRGVINWDEEKIGSTLNELSQFSFVKTRPGGGLSLHDSMRELLRSYVWPSVDPDRAIRISWNNAILTYRNKVSHSASIEEYEFKKIKTLIKEQLFHKGFVDSQFFEMKNVFIGNSFYRFAYENTEFDIVYDADRETLALAKKSIVQRLSGHWKRLANHSISKSRFEEISKQFIQSITEVLEADHVFATSELDGGDSLVFHLKLNSVFTGSRLPSRLPIIIQRCYSFGEKELNSLYDVHLSNQLNSRIAMLITFIPDNELENAQALLENKIRQVYAYDILLVGYEDIMSLVASKNPPQVLRSLLLSRVDLTAISPFVTTGYASDDIFFGREHVLREITEHVNSVNYALVGGRRIGKTSILKRLQRVRLPSVDYYALYHDCSISPTQEEFAQAILADRSWFSETPVNSPSTIIGIFNKLPHDRPLIILLDEVDKLISPDRVANYPLLKTLRALSNTGRCHFVLSGERALRLELTNPSSPLYNFANEIVVGRLDYHDIEELVTRPMRQLEIELVNEKAIIQGIWTFTSGHPNVAQRLCQRLIVLLNNRHKRRLTSEDVDEIVADPDFLRKDFLNVYWERATALERLCSLTMVADKNARTLMTIQANLNGYGVKVELNQVDDALERLTDLRNILHRTPDGYDFAVIAFPIVVTRTARLNDLIALTRETYQRYGDVEPKSKRGVS